MEIVFTEDGWSSAAILCTFLFIMLMLIVEGIFIPDAMRHSPGGYRINRPSFYIGWSITLVILYAAANGVVMLGSSSSTPDEPASIHDLAEHFGLESGEQYPLILGDDQGSGVLGNATAEAGLFAASATIDLRPTSTVSVGFQKDDRWWQLTLPTSTTTFMKGADEPTVMITLNDATFSEYALGTWRQTWSDCKWELRNLWFVCQRSVETRTLEVPGSVESEGLANVVSRYFHSAEIHLTNEQHARLFPTN